MRERKTRKKTSSKIGDSRVSPDSNGRLRFWFALNDAQVSGESGVKRERKGALNSDWSTRRGRYSQINKPRLASPHFCLSTTAFPLVSPYSMARTKVGDSFLPIFVSFLLSFLFSASSCATGAPGQRVKRPEERGRSSGSWNASRCSFPLALPGLQLALCSLFRMLFRRPCWI
jgi:hypothetical protein